MLCTYLSIANNLKDLAEPAASDPLHNLIRRLIAFCEPRTLWHDFLIELRGAIEVELCIDAFRREIGMGQRGIRSGS
jgi:hypothetical protein